MSTTAKRHSAEPRPNSSAGSFWQRQFSEPSGLMGRAVGWIMAHQNAAMNRMAIDCLEVRPGDAVLEIGFGPGQAIAELVRRLPTARITGIDPSPDMASQAQAANVGAIKAGRVLLVQGEVGALPFEAGEFARIFAVSNFHQWPDRAAGLAEVRRTLQPGGRLVLCLRLAARHPLPWSSPGLTASELEQDRKLLAKAGFHDTQTVVRRLGRRIACLLAHK